jgi:hypothetical protein
MRLTKLAPPVLLLCLALTAAAQPPADGIYSRLNTFSGFVEYSNDSSHIILGNAENRKIGALGFQYQRRMVNRRLWNMSYTAEMRPGMMESDPVSLETIIAAYPVAGSYPQQPVAVMRCFDAAFAINEIVGTTTYTNNYVYTCGRRMVFEQGFSPAGIRFNLMPHHRLQPTFSSFGGYMFATQVVPIPDAGSFNYTFEFGAGLEFFRSRNRSVRLEYQVQHYSNKKTGNLNPGVDSGFVKMTYAFGR